MAAAIKELVEHHRLLTDLLSTVLDSESITIEQAVRRHLRYLCDEINRARPMRANTLRTENRDRWGTSRTDLLSGAVGAHGWHYRDNDSTWTALDYIDVYCEDDDDHVDGPATDDPEVWIEGGSGTDTVEVNGTNYTLVSASEV